MARRVLINCWGSYGDVYPYIGLAKALQSRGLKTTIATLNYYREAVEQENIEFAHAGLEVDPADRETIARVMHPAKGPEAVVRDLVVPALTHSYDELQRLVTDDDLLVSHPLTFSVRLVAEKRRLPWVSTLLAPLGFFSATDLPVIPNAPWLVNLRGLGAWFGRLVVSLGHRATRPWVEPIEQLRRELGLPPAGHPLFEGQFSPLLTLALFSRVLATPQPDWPPHAHTTGFVFYNGRGTLDSSLASFLENGPPPVVFTLGTSAVGAAGRFYEESAAAAGRLGVRAVLLTGGLTENQPSGASAKDILLVDRAPHQLLFPRASVIVHQGGIGTTAQALRSGRPMLVVPHAHDQPDNAFRVTTLGVARTVFPRAYKADRVCEVLKQLLHDERYRERARAVAALVSAEDGASAAADAIVRLAA